MIPLLAAPLVVALCYSSGSHQQKSPVSPLEGVWREPLLPADMVSDKMVATITGDAITLAWCGKQFRGTIGAGTTRELTVIEFVITLSTIDGKKTESTHTGRCIIQDNCLYLQVVPRSPDPKLYEGGIGRELAPITFKLEKLKK
jgi:hypothetical protein